MAEAKWRITNQCLTLEPLKCEMEHFKSNKSQIVKYFYNNTFSKEIKENQTRETRDQETTWPQLAQR